MTRTGLADPCIKQAVLLHTPLLDPRNPRMSHGTTLLGFRLFYVSRKIKPESLQNWRMVDAIRELMGMEPLYSKKTSDTSPSAHWGTSLQDAGLSAFGFIPEADSSPPLETRSEGP